MKIFILNVQLFCFYASIVQHAFIPKMLDDIATNIVLVIEKIDCIKRLDDVLVFKI